MLKVTNVLKKINNISDPIALTLLDVMPLSLYEIYTKYSASISYEEAEFLYQQAQLQLQKNKLKYAKIVAQNNPQLSNIDTLGLNKSKATDDYNKFFPERKTKYAPAGAVSSMFSPAGYLTELYREARDLHLKDSVYHLDNRRPDLKQLMLNQDNLEKEISTLELSNKILFSTFKENSQKEKDSVLTDLSTNRFSAKLPYHESYQILRESIVAKNLISAIYSSSYLQDKVDNNNLLKLKANISPELYKILTEDIKDPNNVIGENFKTSQIKSLQTLTNLMSYYSLTNEELNYLFLALDIKDYEKKPDIEYKGSLLKLNKIIRFNRASGMDFESIIQILKAQKVTDSIKDVINVDITVDNLETLLYCQYLMHTYHIDAETASILSFNNINDKKIAKQPSQFDRLFNTPLLGNKKFEVKNTYLDFSKKYPIDSEQAFEINVIKRAFNVNEMELALLWELIKNTNDDFICDIANLSVLYKVSLLAKIHHISVVELVKLSKILPDSFKSALDVNSTKDIVKNLTHKINHTIKWLNKKQWNISIVYLMVGSIDMVGSSDHMIATPEIEKIASMLRNDLGDEIFLNGTLDDKDKIIVKELEAEPIFSTLSSVLAGALNLDSPEKMQAVLLWLNQLNQLKPGRLNVQQFVELFLPKCGKKPDEKPSNKSDDKCNNNGADISINAIAFMYQMIQLATIVKLSAINGDVLTEFVKKPQILDSHLAKEKPEIAILPHNFETLQKIVNANRTIMDSGTMANEVTTLLDKNLLTDKLLAEALKQGKEAIRQALIYIFDYTSVDKNIPLKIPDYKTINLVQQILEVTEKNQISPSSLKVLLDTNTTKLLDMSKVAESILTPTQAEQLSNIINEKRSIALSAYYLNITPPFSNNTDNLIEDVYNYLLLDTQVSSQIKTTQIAEAIASIQLYVNNCLNGVDTEVIPLIKERLFFKEWELYNRRYSTWAGVSQLVYYPENYIDPTIRIGQTKMMDELLQSVSQTGITTDAVEDSFKSYLTTFEQIADLKVISGYHDNLYAELGKTYFIGCSPSEKNHYYWRSADHSKMVKDKENNNKLTMLANAWTEWQKIETSITPYNNIVRPVIFNDRFYIVWLEKDERPERTEKIGENISTNKLRYRLCLSYLRYDNTWSIPLDLDFSDDIEKFKTIDFIKDGVNDFNFFCSFNKEGPYLVVVFYNMKNLPNEAKGEEINKNTMMYFISDKMSKVKLEEGNRKENFDFAKKYFERYGEKDNKDKILRRVTNPIVVYQSFINHEPRRIEHSTISKDYNLEKTKITAVSELLKDNSSETTKYSILKCLFNSPIQLYKNPSILESYAEPIERHFNTYQWRDCDVEYLIYRIGKYVHNTYDELFDSIVFVVNKTYMSYGCCLFNTELRTFISNYSYLNYIYLDRKGTKVNLLNVIGNKERLTSDNIKILLDIFNSEDKDRGNVFLKFTYKDAVQTATNDGMKDIYRNPDRIINNIVIEINCDKHYSFKDWYDKSQYFEPGYNAIDPIEDVLSVNIPFSYLKDKDTSELSFDVIGYNNKSKVILKSTYYFDIKYSSISKLELVDNNLIYLNTNNAGAQYISFGGNKGVNPHIRLNTLFANKLTSRANKGINAILSLETQQLKEPSLYEDQDDDFMDFNGANALYFWELFYYTPMMVADFMLQDRNYDEANRWLRYVFDPSGMPSIDDHRVNYWNTRPLLEDTSWNDTPLDSTNPDAVAQMDPIHYKLATFMKMLDLLIARGDAAYRQLERDTLNEAKMWYSQALKLLGKEKVVLFTDDWSAITLESAADKTDKKAVQQTIMLLGEPEQQQEMPITANSLTPLFLPQVNEKLSTYWQILKQRLFNLRNNLSIDGHPLLLPIFAAPADPKSLLYGAVNAAQNFKIYPKSSSLMYRFPVIIESAKNIVAQLIEFGSSLLSLSERHDDEKMLELLTNQGAALLKQSLMIHDKTQTELTEQQNALSAQKTEINNRFNHFKNLIDQDLSLDESMSLALSGLSTTTTSMSGLLTVAAKALDIAPNTVGTSVGGSKWSSIAEGFAFGLATTGQVMETVADIVGRSAEFRRRAEEWELEKKTAEQEEKQIDAEIKAIEIRIQAEKLQKVYLQTEQRQNIEQLTLLQKKFTNKALYSWLRGRLLAIYTPFYDLAVSRCSIAEAAYQYEMNIGKDQRSFINPAAWQSAYSGLMAGETLMLNLVQLEKSYLERDKRVLEVTRTVSLADIYSKQEDRPFTFADIAENLRKDDGFKAGNLGNNKNFVSLVKDSVDDTKKELQAVISIPDLKIAEDYPEGLGKYRLVLQISVTLPALIEPYQDVRAILEYEGAETLPKGCKAIAVSHGMNDSGQFHLDFGDDCYFPFEGLDVRAAGSLKLRFFDATTAQKELLLSLTDIVLHIRYTIY